MYDQYFETLSKNPLTPLIMWGGFGLIGLWGAVSLFVLIMPGKPRLWIVKKLCSSGEKYEESKRLKITYISYSVGSLVFSFKTGSAIFIFLSAAILVLNISILFAIFLVKNEDAEAEEESEQFDSESK